MKARGLMAAATALLLSACVTGHQSGSSGGVQSLQPGYRPAADTDEAGLWMMMDKAEQTVKTSAARVRDPDLNDLIGDVMRRLSPEHHRSLRHYILRNPEFNATAAPNGIVEVWSGLLIRMRTESELAAVLGHEITHYTERHSLARMRHVRDTKILGAFLNLGTAMVGGGASAMAFNDLVAVGEIQSFSRDNERDSDAGGMERLVRAGYDPAAAAAVWKRLMDLKKAKKEFQSFGEQREWELYFASHPTDEEREETLRELAEKAAKPSAPPPDRLRRALIPVRLDFLLDEVKMGRFRESKALFEMLLTDDPAPGQILYALGELHRKRGKDNDELEALSYFHQACEAAGAPIQAYRMTATMRWRRGETELAREFFRRYLKAAPDAPDRALVQSYLESR